MSEYEVILIFLTSESPANLFYVFNMEQVFFFIIFIPCTPIVRNCFNFEIPSR
ncbi:hypothetical protein J2S09_000112 [Bacillus fengqiuensis]|nr:hypothetical protein [Bacillus fengqiuensis]